MYNKVTIEGIATTTPILKTSRNKILYTFFTIENKGDNKGNSSYIDCMAWRENAEYICNSVKKGQEVTITGKLMTMTQTNEKSKLTYINVDKAYIEAQNESTPIDFIETIDIIKEEGEVPF